MHAEAVKVGARPSQIGLITMPRVTLICGECAACYHLYYDSDAEASCAYWSQLAQEIIEARHPHHTDNVVLDELEKF